MALTNSNISYTDLVEKYIGTAYDKMAEINVRYAEKYPDSKDVEQMLFSSGKYFFKAGKLDRAKRAFENYTKRYPNSKGEIEARYNIALIIRKKGDLLASEKAFEDLIERNDILRKTKKNNDFYAAEAAFSLAGIIRKKFMAIKFTLPKKKMAKQQKEKAALLKKTITAYSKVISFKSEKIFEAAFRIGEAYHHFANIDYPYWLMVA